MEDDWDIAEKKVLAENTAQAILKHLKRLEVKRATVGARWIWELLQNARDAAKPGGVNVSVELGDKELTFSHDGRPFRREELAHLIYHGTTKLDDDQNVGHFGSGFVSTHLLSRRVQISGALQGGGQFEFWLDRSSSDQHELADAMQHSMRECKQSCEQTASSGDAHNTVFVYPLVNGAVTLATSAVEDLKAWGPLVLALATEIASIRINTTSGSLTFKRSAPQRLADNLELATIQVEDGSYKPSHHHIAVARTEHGVQAALPLSQTEGHFSITIDGHTPRVFVLFPILGTDKLGLPAVLQSKEFEPVEDRDGIWLSNDSDAAVKNRATVEKAMPAVQLLIQTAADQKWGNTDRALALDLSARPDWVDDAWLRQLLATLLEEVRETAVVPIAGAEWVTAQTAWLPISESGSFDPELWELLHALSESVTKLPAKEHASSWSQNLKNWGHLLNCPTHKLPAAFTLSRLARLVSETETIAGLASKLTEPAEVLLWLNRFLKLVQATRQTTLHDEFALLPSQRGRLCKRRELAVDQGIANSLKNVGEALGIEVRGGLLDPVVLVHGLNELLSTKTEQQVVDELLGTLKKACQTGRMPKSMVIPSVELFWWLASRKEYASAIDGFPVATAESSDDSCVVVEMPRREHPESRLLAPVAVWTPEAARFAALFPKRRVLHPDFCTAASAESWSELKSRGLVHVGPLHTASQRLEDGLPIEPLADDAEHRSDVALEMSNIACLTDKDVGLLDTSRKSRTRAVHFIEFVLQCVLPNDLAAFEPVPLHCECGQDHRVYRAAWLGPMRRRKWVPLEHASQDYASAESLAALLSGRDDLVKQLETESGRALLHALGISPADLALRVVAPDEESRVSLIRSVGELAEAAGGVDGVRQLVHDIQDDPQILDAIAERKENRERVRKNQDVGALVEQLLREHLETRNLKVERTGTGSDFEVESDFVESDKEVVLRLRGETRSLLLEVKSARGDHVKMTPRQAKTACDEQEGFALCVVAIGDEAPSADLVRESCRFLFGVGAHLADAWAAYEDVEAATDAAQLTDGNVELEIIEGQVRFKVARELWSSGMNLDAAVAEIVKRSEAAKADSA